MNGTGDPSDCTGSLLGVWHGYPGGQPGPAFLASVPSGTGPSGALVMAGASLRAQPRAPAATPSPLLLAMTLGSVKGREQASSLSPLPTCPSTCLDTWGQMGEGRDRQPWVGLGGLCSHRETNGSDRSLPSACGLCQEAPAWGHGVHPVFCPLLHSFFGFKDLPGFLVHHKLK